MMIKLLLISLAFFGCSLLFPLAMAQEASPQVPSPSPVDYVLPFPGILPDHPLYPVKKIRDSLLLLMITNPLRKVEFHQLMADKQLNMATFLADKEKYAHAVESLDAGITHQKAALTLVDAEKEALSDHRSSLRERMTKALAKQAEVLTQLEQKLPTEYDEKLTNYGKQIQELTDRNSAP